MPKQTKPDVETPSLGTQHESVVDELIVGTKSKIEDQYSKLTTHYDSKSNPIGVEEAKNVIASLITIAIGQRRLLGERISNSIGYGGIFGHYFGKLKQINDSNVKYTTNQEEVEAAEKKYKKHFSLLEKVERNSLNEGYRPNDKETSEPLNYDE